MIFLYAATATLSLACWPILTATNLQCSLPSLLHVDVPSLDAIVVGEVHPFGKVFFEVRLHLLIGGPALQDQHTAKRGNKSGIVWREAEQADNFSFFLWTQMWHLECFAYQQILHQALIVDWGERHTGSVRSAAYKWNRHWGMLQDLLTGTYRRSNCPEGQWVWRERQGLRWWWSQLSYQCSWIHKLPSHMKPPPCLWGRRKYSLMVSFDTKLWLNTFKHLKTLN